jgi:hypothetical protein
MCGSHTAQLLVHGGPEVEAASLNFRFENGTLVEVSGSEVALTEGVLRAVVTEPGLSGEGDAEAERLLSTHCGHSRRRPTASGAAPTAPVADLPQPF